MSVYRFISAQKARTPVSMSCRLLEVSRSGYYDWARRAPSDRVLSDAWLLAKIKQIHAANRGVYGARRVHAELRLAQGIRVGRKRVERLMRQAEISGLVRRKRGKTTIRVPGVRVADDLVERQFRPAGPNVLWVECGPVDLGVDRGDIPAAVAQHLPDLGKAPAGAQQLGRGRAPQTVSADHRQPRALARVLHDR